MENKEKLFSKQNCCASSRAFRNLWIKSSSSFWGYKLMLWALIFLFFNVSFVCPQWSSWYWTKRVQVAIRVNSIEAGMFSAASNCLLKTWLQKAFFPLPYLIHRLPFIFFAVMFPMSTRYQSWKSLPVTFRDKAVFSLPLVARCFNLSQFSRCRLKHQIVKNCNWESLNQFHSKLNSI